MEVTTFSISSDNDLDGGDSKQITMNKLNGAAAMFCSFNTVDDDSDGTFSCEVFTVNPSQWILKITAFSDKINNTCKAECIHFFT